MTQPPPPPQSPPPAPPPLAQPSSFSTKQNENSAIRLKIKTQKEIQNLQTAHLTEPDHPAPGPGWYFFYGTLMSPALIAAILGLEEVPVMRPAKVHHFKLKMWGQYPALVNGTGDDQVQGVAWEVQEQEHAERLAKYETRAYEVAACKILFTYGKGKISDETVAGFTFVSCFPPERLREREGTFDLQDWLMRKSLA